MSLVKLRPAEIVFGVKTKGVKYQAIENSG